MRVASLNVWHKLVLIAVILTIPFAVAAWFVVADLRDERAQLSVEHTGAELVAPTLELARLIQHHEFAQAARIRGIVAPDGLDVDALRAQIETTLTGIESLNESSGGNADLSESIGALRTAWSEIAQLPASTSLVDTLDAHEELVDEQVLGFLGRVGRETTLALDPTVEGYYLQDLILDAIPSVAESLGELAAWGLVAPPRATGGDPTTERIVEKVDDEAGQVGRNLAFLQDGAPAAASALAPLRESADAARESLEQVVQQGETPSAALSGRVIAEGVKAIDTQYAFGAEATKRLIAALDQRSATATNRFWTTVAMLALVLALAIAAMLLMARRMTRSLGALTDAYEQVARGELDADVPVTSSDEIGRMSTAFNATLVELRKTRELERHEVERTDELRDALAHYGRFTSKIAAGELTARVTTGWNDPQLETLGTNLNKMGEQLEQLSGQVREAATQMSGATSQILAVVSQHTAASTEQAASVAQTSVTIDEVRASASQMAERAGVLADQAREMVDMSVEGLDAVEGIVSGMALIRSRVDQIAIDIASLSERTQAIESITQSVSDLADQSNMLALNATIEAARAGEQGRGFAVVAQEVRNLAEQSKQATGQVREILDEIQRATATVVKATEEGTLAVEDGVERARRAGDLLDKVEANSQEAAHFATTIAASVREQHVGMDQIAQAMADVSSSSTQMATGAADTQGAAEFLATLAGTLDELTGHYQVAERAVAASTDESAEVEDASPQALVEDLAQRLDVECAVLARFDADDLVVPLATVLPHGQTLKPFKAEGAGAFATVVRTGAPARVDDYSKLGADRVAAVARAGAYRSSVCIPIYRGTKVWGAVLVATSTSRPIPRGAEAHLTRAARAASKALDREFVGAA